jgi:hypothetical protein
MTAPRETAAEKTRWPATRMTGTRALAAIVGPGATDDSQEEIPDMILASSNGRDEEPHRRTKKQRSGTTGTRNRLPAGHLAP